MTALFTLLLLQVDSLASQISLPVVPAGFNWWYVAIYAAGMIVHFAFHTGNVGAGWKALFTSFKAQFVTYFFNRWHLTALSAAPAAVLALATQYGLNLGFGTLNALAIIVSAGAGYIGDSMFNSGTPTPPKA